MIDNFRSNVGDILGGKIKDIYGKNIDKARKRKHALDGLKRKLHGTDSDAPALG